MRALTVLVALGAALPVGVPAAARADAAGGPTSGVAAAVRSPDAARGAPSAAIAPGQATTASPPLTTLPPASRSEPGGAAWAPTERTRIAVIAAAVPDEADANGLDPTDPSDAHAPATEPAGTATPPTAAPADAPLPGALDAAVLRELLRELGVGPADGFELIALADRSRLRPDDIAVIPVPGAPASLETRDAVAGPATTPPAATATTPDPSAPATASSAPAPATAPAPSAPATPPSAAPGPTGPADPASASDKRPGLAIAGDPAELPLAVRVAAQQLGAHGAVPGGRHEFAPDSPLRSVHIDIARKHYPLDELLRLVRESAWSGITEIELHFSENEGFAIESRSHPGIASADAHSHDDIRALIDFAAALGVRITPSLDMPGHLDHALDAHPDLRLRDAAGGEVFGALDVSNPTAVDFALDLVDEYAALFEPGAWNLGADEFVDFGDPFEVGGLDAWAASEFGAGATAYDAQTWFVNLVAERLAEHGYAARVWSDGMLRAGVVELDPGIEVAYWSQRPPGAVPAADFAQRGHPLVNVNDEFLYFVLGERVEYYYPSGERILAEWDAGTFPSIGGAPERLPFGAADPAAPSLVRGGMFAIWSDVPGALTAAEVVDRTRLPIAATALKLADPDAELDWAAFVALVEAVGDSPALGQDALAAARADAAGLEPRPRPRSRRPGRRASRPIAVDRSPPGPPSPAPPSRSRSPPRSPPARPAAPPPTRAPTGSRTGGRGRSGSPARPVGAPATGEPVGIAGPRPGRDRPGAPA
ncbi:MAG: family 20 glycosylhydrolase [Microbacteriaceae bacterium]|nr:family 20 glycosylhydrolase [Microbacteriaceae bacterium]